MTQRLNLKLSRRSPKWYLRALHTKDERGSMSEETEDNYAAKIGRSMWRMAKRRALSVLEPRLEAAALTRAAFPGAPESKGRPLAASHRQAGHAPGAPPLTLREFLKTLGEELESDDPRRGGS